MKATTTFRLQYPFKVWGISIVLGTALAILYGHLTSAGSEFDVIAFLGGTILGILFGFVFSIPAFFVYYISFRIFIKKIRSTVYLKLILTAIAVLSMIITFYFLFGREFSIKDQADLFLPYSIGIIIAGKSVRI